LLALLYAAYKGSKHNDRKKTAALASSVTKIVVIKVSTEIALLKIGF